MSTSGSTDHSLTAQGVVDQAYDIMALKAGGETLAAEDAARGLAALELLLKTWSAQGRLWLAAETSLTLVASQASYALASSVRRVTGVRRRTSDIDTPLCEIGREEYFDLPTKAATGTPVSWYADSQRPRVTFYIWPTATSAAATSTTLRYTYERVIEDCDTLTNDPDVPQEWLEPLAWGLADRLKGRYGVPDGRKAEIAQTAGILAAQLSATDEDSASVFFSAGLRR